MVFRTFNTILHSPLCQLSLVLTLQFYMLYTAIYAVDA